jgi:hypothetical protein
MNVTPKTVARQIVVARAEAARKPVFTSETGVTRVVRGRMGAAEYDFDNCPTLSRYGQHIMDEVEADLPGDRSVGFCVCRKWIDTGTWDERNAE